MKKVRDWLKNRKAAQFELNDGRGMSARRFSDDKIFQRFASLHERHTKFANVDYVQDVYIGRFDDDDIHVNLGVCTSRIMAGGYKVLATEIAQVDASFKCEINLVEDSLSFISQAGVMKLIQLLREKQDAEC